MANRRRPARRQKSAKPTDVTLTIDRLGASGDGLCADIAVPFTLPGETVSAKLTGKRAQVTEILSPSPSRAMPPCPHFGRPGDACGGCKLQHLQDTDYIAFKRDKLMAALPRAGIAAPEPAIHRSPPASRRRAKIALERRGGKVAAGFHALGSDRLVALTACHILTPALFALTQALASAAVALPFSRTASAQLAVTDTGPDVALNGIDEAAMTLAQREAAAAMAAELDLARLSVGGVTMAEARAPSMLMGGVPVDVPPGAFLQATAQGQDALTAIVMEAASGAGAVADLFCGIGTFALPLSASAAVCAIEGDDLAVDALAAAARRAARPVNAQRRDLFERPLMPAELAAFDVVVLDPPRAGAAAQCAQLAVSSVPKVVYVSCDPKALARDLGTLSACYDVTALHLVDQFVWSPHIEAVAVLERR